MRTFTSYLELLKSLLPRGRAWRGKSTSGSVLNQVLAAEAVELSRVDQRMDDLLAESDSRTTIELIGEYEDDFDIAITKNTPPASFSRSSPAYGLNGKVGINTPRFGPGRLGEMAGAMLMETQMYGGNSLFPDLVNVWTSTGLTMIANRPDPFGKNEGFRLTETNTNGQHGVITAFALGLTIGGKFTYSFYLKPAGRSYCMLFIQNAGQTNSIKVNYDLIAGTAWYQAVAGTMTGTSRIIALSNGWFRAVITVNIGTSENIYFGINLQKTNDQIIQYLGDPEKSLLACFPQLEGGDLLTSYYDVNPGFRYFDSCTAPTSGTLSMAEGTISFIAYTSPYMTEVGLNASYFFDVIKQPDIENILCMFSWDGSAFNYHVVSYPSGNIATGPATLPEGWHLFVVRWSLSEMTLFIDGVKYAGIGPPSSGTIDDRVYIGATNTISCANTYLCEFMFFNKMLSDYEVSLLAPLLTGNLNLILGSDIERLITRHRTYYLPLNNTLSTSGEVYNIDTRRAAVRTKLVTTGSMQKSYYIEVAATLGYTITIDEYVPAWSGAALSPFACGDQQVIFHWRVNILYDAAKTYTDLIDTLNTMKPAHSQIDWRVVGPAFSSAFSPDFGYTTLPKQAAFSSAFSIFDFDVQY